MSHVKAGASRASQKANVIGKRRGLKVTAGQQVHAGQILVRQVGTKYHPGDNVKVSRDYTLVARTDGIVVFTHKRYPRGVRTVVSVVAEAK